MTERDTILALGSFRKIRLVLRITDEEYDELHAAAKRANLSLSHWAELALTDLARVETSRKDEGDL